MWQLLLKILEFMEWQYSSSLHKRGPNSAPLKRYKSLNTSLESGELVQICTLWEQKLAHKVKECNSVGSPVPLFHLGCTPANMFCNFASFLVLTSSKIYGKRRALSLHPHSLPLTPAFKKCLCTKHSKGPYLRVQRSVSVLMKTKCI